MEAESGRGRWVRTEDEAEGGSNLDYVPLAAPGFRRNVSGSASRGNGIRIYVQEGLEDTMSETVACPFCEADVPATAQKCRHCGEWISRECLKCGTPIRGPWAARGMCADCEKMGGTDYPVAPSYGAPQVPAYQGIRKSRSVSVGLSLVFGGLGAHKFYLNKPGAGFLYLLFCWTGIPSIIGIIEGVRYITMDEEEFQRKYSMGRL